MPLSDVEHQDCAHERMQKALACDRLHHACLFTGPSGIGKEMFATRFAAVLLCDSPVQVPAPAESPTSCKTWQEACGQCDSCRIMAAGNHPDFHRIHRTLIKHVSDPKAQRHKATTLGIDVIRQFLIASIGLRPSLSRSKVFVVVEAERLIEAAQNAMLKTLEEPPRHSYLILLATTPDALLETIRSRCQQIAFQPLPAEFIRRHLIDHGGLPEEEATFIAELSQGSLGDAMSFHAYGLGKAAPRFLDMLKASATDPLGFSKTLQGEIEALAKLVKENSDPDAGDTNITRTAQNTLLAVLSTIMRDVQRAAVGSAPAAFPTLELVPRLGQATTALAVRGAIRAIGAAEYQIGRSVNSKMIFDNLGVAISRGLAPRA